MAVETSDNTENGNAAGNGANASAQTISVDNAEVNEKEMKNSPLHQLFIVTLEGMYSGEHDILEVLGNMQRSATTKELKAAFDDHYSQTRKHISRLEKIFELINDAPKKKESKAVRAIIDEGLEMVRFTEKGSMTRDAALIIAAQKVEHYEIATYGGLAQLAKVMGHDKATDLLRKTLQEEKDTDYRLTEIAETLVNFDAQQED